MAKTIKFSLKCDGYPVRTIEDLQNHFSIEDVLHYYKTGLLEKWLEIRRFSRELEQICKIGSNKDDATTIPLSIARTASSVRLEKPVFFRIF